MHQRIKMNYEGLLSALSEINLDATRPPRKRIWEKKPLIYLPVHYVIVALMPYAYRLTLFRTTVITTFEIVGFTPNLLLI